jgi:hypothetical protein
MTSSIVYYAYISLSGFGERKSYKLITHNLEDVNLFRTKQYEYMNLVRTREKEREPRFNQFGWEPVELTYIFNEMVLKINNQEIEMYKHSYKYGDGYENLTFIKSLIEIPEFNPDVQIDIVYNAINDAPCTNVHEFIL